MTSRLLSRNVVLLLSVALLATGAAFADSAEMPRIDIPFERFVLDNGLTVLVHEDRKAPIVAVNVWYHVGSKDEPEGRSGFAHLFEHLMFNGSENFDGEYVTALESVGATDANGTTNEDRTNYFQNVPTSALDVALWLESDRMGHLLGAITQDKLDEQRGVVQNEKRQGENQPYGLAYERITEAVFPPGHPYSWTVIGSMEDLNAASLEDVKEWFRQRYGASNAVLVLAGDIDVETVREKVAAAFGDVPPGPPLARRKAWIAERSESVRDTAEDRVAQARIYKVWNIPEWGSADADFLDLATEILSEGKSSRLYKRLVYDDQSATSVSAYVDLREIAGLFTLELNVAPGHRPAAVEAAAMEELERLIAEGPTAAEVERARARWLARFARGAERIGGFGGKSDILAQCQVFRGDGACYQETLERVAEATPADLQRVLRRWATRGDYTLTVTPWQERKAAEPGVDRSALPAAGEAPEPRFPEIEYATLDNGLEVVFARRDAVPLVNLTLMVEAGTAADPAAEAGTAQLALAMLDEGAGEMDALEISDRLAELGATLGTFARLDTSLVSMSALASNLEPSLDLLSRVALEPSFPPAELERLMARQRAAVEREKTQPFALALRVLPERLYGADHPYGKPLTGSGTLESLDRIERQDLVDFHRTWFKPNHATLVVVGDTTLGELRPALEEAFGDWQAGDVPALTIAPVELPAAEAVYLIDRPGAVQSILLAGQVVMPTANPNEVPFELFMRVLGGDFTSRLNLNLREDKGWSYGSFSFAPDALGQRPLIALAPVQADKTAESIVEMRKELGSLVGDRPVSEEEMRRARDNRVLQLPGSWETAGEVSAALEEQVRFGLPEDYWQNYPSALRGVTLDAVHRIGRKALQPDRVVWVVVGDLEAVEESVRALDIGPVERLDAAGRPIDP
ncbi:MAG: pitrilysin family protein [Acidobacteriota bacterium]